ADANGNCTLRAAVEEANALPPDSGITLPAGEYSLQNGPLILTQNMSIVGDSARTTTIDRAAASRNFRIIQVSGGQAHISNVTITGGFAGSGDDETNAGVGGGIWVDSPASLSLDHAAVVGNTAGRSGGGIDNNGSLAVDASLIANN